MTDPTQKLVELLELANNYPSPHNGQPMQVREASAAQLEVYFDTSRGLVATPISYLFSFVTIGVFMKHFELCAEALGHKVQVTLDLPKTSAMGQPGKLRCGTIDISYDVAVPNSDLQAAIKTRQTSRKKYQSGLEPSERKQVEGIAGQYPLKHHFVSGSQAHQIIWLNQRAVFDDMFNAAVRKELAHWLRFSDAEKHTKKDGLAYDCMELSGASLKAAVRYYKILHWPIVAPWLKRYYLRTMKDSSTVGYITAPFQTELQAYTIGRCIMDIWLELTKCGKYLHPFGTIVSNDVAHKDFANIVGLSGEARKDNYVVFIYRAGQSEPPVRSERIPITEHIYLKGENV